MAIGPFDPSVFDPAIFDTGEEPSFASVDWTGVERRVASDPALLEDIQRRIEELDAVVEKTGLTNAEQAKAKAITSALRSLVASPEPEWKVIVDLLNAPALKAALTAIGLMDLAMRLIELIVA